MIKDKQVCNDQLLIVEKYERVIAYLYPIIQRTPRKHGIARDRFLDRLFEQPELFIQAGKSGQISKLYAADANLAMLRFYIRFFREGLSHITINQESHAQVLIAEVGAIMGAWINRLKGQSRS
jgi:hypothetical protein